MITSFAFLSTAALKATIVLSTAFLVAFVLRRASASARYLVWTGALATVLALPLLSLSVRPWSVPVSVPLTPAPEIREVAAAPGPVASSQPNNLSVWLLAVWLCGVGAVLARTAIGHLRVQLMLRSSDRVGDAGWLQSLHDARGRIGLRRRVDLRRSQAIDVPLSYGLIRPVVVLPDAAAEWNAGRRGVVLVHELIHVRRFDSLICLIAQLAAAAYWFHPLAWMALARLRREQERSCDDAVVIAGTGQSAYAEHLVALARSVASPPRTWPAAISMAEHRGLEQRVRALLDPHRKRRPLSARVCAAAFSMLLACAIPFAALRAQDTGPKSSLAGSVFDMSGAALPEATVLLKNANGKNQEIVRSGPAGEYQFASIAAGKYDVEVRAPGFAAYHRSGVELSPGTPLRLDMKLEVGSVSEAITIVGRGPRSAVASGTPRRIRVGGNVQATRLLHMVKPVYPAAAQAAGIEGTVLLRAVISTQGSLLGLVVMNTSIDPELAQAAMDAVKQWQYQPTLLNGVPVEVLTTITVTFKLEH